MKLFSETGHLTDAGLTALLNESLDEMGRLEAAEHLSFCDECLERYTLLLRDDALMQPPEPLREPVLRRLRRRATAIAFNRYTTVAAAAVLAVGLWSLGIFTAPAKLGTSPTPPTSATSQQAERRIDNFGQRVDEAFAGVTGSVNSFFNNLVAPKPRDTETTQEEDRQKQEEERKKRDEVFNTTPLSEEDNTIEENKAS